MESIGADASLTAKVVEAVHGAIISGELEPGCLYSVNQLAEQLSVSRTPVREAFIKLAEQGIVRFEKNRGIRILQISVRDIEDVFSLRLLLEVPATARSTQLFTAADRRELGKAYAAMLQAAESGDEPKLMSHDRHFHGLLLQGAGNRVLAKFVDGLRNMILLRGITTSPNRSLTEIVKEHEPILRYAEAKSTEKAAQAMREHLLNTASVLISHERGAGEAGIPDLEWTTNG